MYDNSPTYIIRFELNLTFRMPGKYGKTSELLSSWFRSFYIHICKQIKYNIDLLHMPSVA